MTPRVFVVVGSPGSGKDMLIRAVNDLGSRHAEIVPKHTNRAQRRDEGKEMFFPGDEQFSLGACDVVYENYGDRYGIITTDIWKGLYNGFNQVVVVSNIEAINKLKNVFGDLLILVYVHSVVSPQQFMDIELQGEHGQSSDEYVAKRSDAAAYHETLEFYNLNITAFVHVLINTGIAEDLYDQLFRLFESYKNGT